MDTQVVQLGKKNQLIRTLYFAGWLHPVFAETQGDRIDPSKLVMGELLNAELPIAGRIS
jgi:hypothetical protein